ncbi:MAG: hypothetical protein RI907_907 [Pseudomonadota bacterium]|jgi:hypothetical protein
MLRTRVVVAVLAAHLLPVVAWASYKPVRVLAPELLGMHCAPSGVCVDDRQRLSEAEALRAEALAFVAHKLGAIQRPPRVIFCATEACSRSFGFKKTAAYNVGTLGAVISHRGWHPHFVRHELIHHLQNERLGTWTAWLLKPSWLTEGMAYAMSEDPREQLPEPLQGWRAAFTRWRAATADQDMWQAAQAVPRDEVVK